MTESSSSGADNGNGNSRVQRAVERGLDRWRRRSARDTGLDATADLAACAPETATPGAGTEVLRPLPRRRFFQVTTAVEPKRIAQAEETFRAGVLRSAVRVVRLCWIGLVLAALILWDWLRRRGSPQSRAIRLRTTLQHAGMTAIKVGQQMSMRIDLLPWAYCSELERLLDQVPPFPLDQAIAEIETTTGRPLQETFSAFDPEPIGSASIACVYHAVLRSGERVAVKVRRPGIGLSLAADLRALGWLLRFAELFALPPGFTRNFLQELSEMLLAELDFVTEARYIELYQRRINKSKLDYLHAPRVYHELSSRAVLVEEFVSGVWLSEMVAILESQDPAGLAFLKASNVDPKRVARRLLMANRWASFEGLLFHADLHPANVVVSAGSRLTLIDFGACGAFTEKERAIWRRFLYAQRGEDVGAMAQAAVNLIEPLPPIDVDQFTAEVEAVFWQDLYAYKSKHSEWWERTSARIWISFLRLSRRYNIPLNLNTLRMIRATMLVDTLALRLDPDINQYAEFTRYEKGAGKRARKRLTKKVRETFSQSRFITLDQAWEAGRNLFYRVQRTLDTPVFRYSDLVGKAAFAAVGVLQFLFGAVAGTAAITAGTAVVLAVRGRPVPITELMTHYVLPSPYYLGLLLLALAVFGRRLLYRLRARDI